MRRVFNLIFILCFILSSNSFAANPKASQVRVDTSDFDNNLDSEVDDVQKLADAVDELASSAPETDPVFAASTAYSITPTNTANWNTAFGWGNHASAGYLSSEVDAVVGNEITNAANGTLTRTGSGTGGSPYNLEINLGNANTWTAQQTFSIAAPIFSTFTSGSILYAGAGGLVSELVSKFCIDSTNYILYLYSTLGAEKVANGGFTGSASSWTVGSGYSYSTNAVIHGSNGTAALQQNISALNGELYLATFTISGWTVGTVTPSLGGVTGTAVGANGTYSQYFLATSTANLAFTPTNTARFTIDNVSVKRLSGGEARIVGKMFTGEHTVSATNSNSTPGTTRHLSFKNPSGSYNWIDNYFGSTLRSAIGFDSSGNIFNYLTSGAAQYWYTISGSYFSYMTASQFYHQGSAIFGGYGQFSSYVYASGAGAFGGSVSAGSATVNPPSKLTSYGGTGFKTQLITQSTTLTDAYTDLSVDGDNANVCTGTPTACGTYTNSTDCGNHSLVGCTYFYGYSCSTYNGEYGMGNCSGTSGCSPDSSSCNSGYDYSSCVNQDDSYGGNCDWVNSPIDCATFGDDSNCGGYAGMQCSYTSGTPSSCYGTVTSCDAWDGDESNCNAHSLFCGWDGMGDCYNSVADCGTWNNDESSCGLGGCSYSAAVAGYCSGSIDSYSCTGNYYTGNCSGNYGAACQGTAACGNLTDDGSVACEAEANCDWLTGLDITFMSDASHGTGFYKFYRAINHGATANVTFYPNTGQTVNGTTSYVLAPGEKATFIFFYFTQACSTWNATNEATCEAVPHNTACVWTACSGDESACGLLGGACYWDGDSCEGIGNCDGIYTARRDWSVFDGV